ncbi:MAG: TIGR01458 family HAD-type hydrolase [Gemmatimonadota bacterium]|nr:MAG: TIGR01458 family HAD-type hydrolase [Gemmatimonadota bacterium]
MAAIGSVHGLLLDLDGTLYDCGEVLPGAIEAVAALRRGGVPLRFVTNTSRFSRREVGQYLESLGIAAGRDELFTTTVGATAWLQVRGIERVALCLPEATEEDFAGFKIDRSKPQAVVVGDLGSDWTFDVMNQAFRWILQGALLVATHTNRFWRTVDGPTLDAGPFVAALEYATGAEATVVGKPSREFFQSAADSLGLGLNAVAMVGDDIVNDVGGIQALGGTGILLRTGKFSQAELTQSHIKPDLLLDSIADLPSVILG